MKRTICMVGKKITWKKFFLRLRMESFCKVVVKVKWVFRSKVKSSDSDSTFSMIISFCYYSTIIHEEYIIKTMENDACSPLFPIK